MFAIYDVREHYEHMARETFYPNEANLGKNCRFWKGIDAQPHSIGSVAVGCVFPKAEMEGRMSCEGVIDDICLYLKSGRKPSSLTEEQIAELRFRIPGITNIDIPPGDINS